MTSLWEAFNSGKIKEGYCDLKSCNNKQKEQLVYKINSKPKAFYVCGDCLDKYEELTTK